MFHSIEFMTFVIFYFVGKLTKRMEGYNKMAYWNEIDGVQKSMTKLSSTLHCQINGILIAINNTKKKYKTLCPLW